MINFDHSLNAYNYLWKIINDRQEIRCKIETLTSTGPVIKVVLAVNVFDQLN